MEIDFLIWMRLELKNFHKDIHHINHRWVSELLKNHHLTCRTCHRYFLEVYDTSCFNIFYDIVGLVVILRSFMLKYLGSSSIQFWSLISTLNVVIYCILWILIMKSELLLYPSSKIINSSVGLYSFVSIYHSVCPIVETISFKLF